MIQRTTPGLTPSLRQRLDAMGLPVAVASADGDLTLASQRGGPEAYLVRSPAFRQAVRRHWGLLSERHGQCVQLWPGLWLAAVPNARRRRWVNRHGAQSLAMVVLCGPELLASDEFRLVCDQCWVDYQMTVRRINTDRLIAGAGEAGRLAAMIGFMQQDTAEVEKQSAELQAMGRQLGESYEELSLLYKLSSNLTLNQPAERFLFEACRELQEVLGLRWMALQLTDQDDRLNGLQGKLIVSCTSKADEALLRQIARPLMARLTPEAHPVIVDDTQTLELPAMASLAHHLLVVSLMGDDRPLGILFGGDKLDGSALSTVDSKLCAALASSLSIFLQNAILYVDLQGMFVGTLKALTAAIDAKDSYTHGHSERVALMSRLLAEAADLSHEQCERVYLSGLVHDVGKIGVPEAVLCKAGRLTAEEFDLIKRHPQIGAHILQDIRQMQDLIPGVLHHHERWDGRGYPHGIGGYEIPLFGRLIGLADAFDAMSSNRTYRRALAHAQVMDEVHRCAGTQFDPDLAELFVQLDFEPFFDLLDKHQRLEDQSARRSA